MNPDLVPAIEHQEVGGSIINNTSLGTTVYPMASGTNFFQHYYL